MMCCLFCFCWCVLRSFLWYITTSTGKFVISSHSYLQIYRLYNHSNKGLWIFNVSNGNYRFQLLIDNNFIFFVVAHAHKYLVFKVQEPWNETQIRQFFHSLNINFIEVINKICANTGTLCSIVPCVCVDEQWTKGAKFILIIL